MQETCRKCHLCISSRTKWYPPFLCSENVPDTPNFLCAGNVQEIAIMSPVLLSNNYFHLCRKCLQEMWRKCAWNVMCPEYRKCAWNFMCPSWFRKCAWILPYSYCTRKSQGNVKISWCRKYTRNVNFPGHFMGFPCPGNLGFLPVIVIIAS